MTRTYRCPEGALTTREGDTMGKERFRLTEEHLCLLRAAQVRWDACEFGAPAINPKRPYGNSDVLRDIAEILGEALFEDAYGETHLNAEQVNRFTKLHLETETALQIILATGRFEPGEYEADRYDRNWRRVL